ncbi:MAG: ABC transporter ATP-binding protein [Paracoccus sp. (in: a-proteobacteria)]|uniref:ABC transporter ATP-binding protein n=1 Tax=Paracoccus sp. TaxID=267 RepID=UPI0026E0087B|nr:ABC transporter ATP-binding protein [Paracoccus sp. (in: a-proteobacteria)]MDO5614302.1 ABC transporter ATP-binding protein [Paracoccus sp. (in: a-proteobacteria)]
MTMALTLSHLTKRFDTMTALNQVSLTVERGQRVALLGHNGAGKSTLMKIVLGLIPYDSGQVSVMGAAPGSGAARTRVAYLPENVAFHPALTGLEMVSFYLRLRGESPSDAAGLLERVGLGHAMQRRIGTYSKGMRQRVGLAQALIGHPGLLVLDEPTSGLDPVSRRSFYELLDGLAAEGAGILLSSHALTEVEARTDRIVILSHGNRMAEGTLADLRRQAALPVSYLLVPQPGAIDALTAALPDARAVAGGLMLTSTQEDKMAVLARVANLSGLIADVEVTPPSLEDIYSHFGAKGAAA